MAREGTGGADDTSAADADALTFNPTVEEASYPGGLPQPENDEDVKLPPAWVRYSVTGVNILTSCVAMAVVKQMLAPATLFSQASASAARPGAAAAAAAEEVPDWMKRRYGGAIRTNWMPGQNAVLRIARDTGVLLGASAAWYGVQYCVQEARGGTDDAVNTTVAGAASASLLGAKLFSDAAGGLVAPRSLVRVGLWAAAGAWMGRAAWHDRRRVQELLLKRQQELEQRHLHVPQDQVKQELDRQLLVNLLRKEEMVKMGKVKQHMQAQSALPEDGRSGASSSNNGTSGGSEGPEAAGDDRAWRQLIESPPWLASDRGDPPGK